MSFLHNFSASYAENSNYVTQSANEDLPAAPTRRAASSARSGLTSHRRGARRHHQQHAQHKPPYRQSFAPHVVQVKPAKQGYQSFAHTLAHLVGRSKDVVHIYTELTNSHKRRLNTTRIPSGMQLGLKPLPLNRG